jgi:hypothetical protein
LATLRQQVLTQLETLSDLEWAAEERFCEAEELLRIGRFHGAVYLFGLACEMWLKLGCFRYRGAQLSDEVQSQLVPAKSWMKMKRPLIPHENFHSLRFWLAYLIAFRDADANPMPETLIGASRYHIVLLLYEDWKIEIRYRRLSSLTEHRAKRVYRDAAWLRQSCNTLWR